MTALACLRSRCGWHLPAVFVAALSVASASPSISLVSAKSDSAVNCNPTIADIANGHGAQTAGLENQWTIKAVNGATTIAAGAPISVQIVGVPAVAPAAGADPFAFGGLALGAYDANGVVLGQWTAHGQTNINTADYQWMTSGLHCVAGTYGFLSHANSGPKDNNIMFDLHIPTSVAVGSTVSVRAVVQTADDENAYSNPSLLSLTVGTPAAGAPATLPITTTSITGGGGSTAPPVQSASCTPDYAPMPGGGVSGPFTASNCLSLRAFDDKTAQKATFVMTASGVGSKYISFGIGQAEHDMTGAVYWIGWIDADGTGHCQQYYCADSSSCNPAPDAAGLTVLQEQTSTSAAGLTQIVCVKDYSLAKEAQDTYPDDTGAMQWVHWAVGSSTCEGKTQCGGHVYRGAANLNIFVGGHAKAKTIWDTLNAGYILCLIIAIIMVLYAFVSNLYLVTKCGQQAKADREIQQWERMHGLQPGRSPLTKQNSMSQMRDRQSLVRGRSMTGGSGRRSKYQTMGAPGALNNSSASVQRWISQWQALKSPEGYTYYFKSVESKEIELRASADWWLN